MAMARPATMAKAIITALPPMIVPEDASRGIVTCLPSKRIAQFGALLAELRERYPKLKFQAKKRGLDDEHKETTLDFFVGRPMAVAAGLTKAHILALRLFASPVALTINRHLHDGCGPRRPHPYPATVLLLTCRVTRSTRTTGPEVVYLFKRREANNAYFMQMIDDWEIGSKHTSCVCVAKGSLISLETTDLPSSFFGSNHSKRGGSCLSAPIL